jgi:hypothetical protein
VLLASLGKQGIGCAEAAVRIICAVRKQGILIGGDPANGTCQADGFVQLTQINPGAASSVIAHRWFGRIGARLDPAAGPVRPALQQRASARLTWLLTPVPEVFVPASSAWRAALTRRVPPAKLAVLQRPTLH